MGTSVCRNLPHPHSDQQDHAIDHVSCSTTSLSTLDSGYSRYVSVWNVLAAWVIVIGGGLQISTV